MKFPTRFDTRFGCLHISMFVSLSTVMQTLRRVFAMARLPNLITACVPNFEQVHFTVYNFASKW